MAKKKKTQTKRQRKEQRAEMATCHPSTSAEKSSRAFTDEVVAGKLKLDYHRSSLCLTSMAWGLVPEELVEAE